MIRSRKQLYKSQLTRPKEQLRHTWWDVLGSVPLGLCLLRDSLFEDLGVFEKHHKQLFKPACWRKGVCAWALMWVGKYLPLSWESGKCEWAAHGDVGKRGRRSDGELCLPMALVAAASSCSKSAFFRGFMDVETLLKGDGLKQGGLSSTHTLLKVSALTCQADVVIARQDSLHAVISSLHLPCEDTK